MKLKTRSGNLSDMKFRWEGAVKSLQDDPTLAHGQMSPSSLPGSHLPRLTFALVTFVPLGQLQEATTTLLVGGSSGHHLHNI